MEHYNKLEPGELERLAILAEEMSEVIHVIGKIMRHGYEGCNPVDGIPNRQHLVAELGDVRYAMIMLCESGDVSKDDIHKYAIEKGNRIGKYLHHQ